MSGDQFEDDDDVPTLSAEALKALQEFYAESQQNQGKIDEDWQLSQFWYDKTTSETLTREVLTLALQSKEYISRLDTNNLNTLNKILIFK